MIHTSHHIARLCVRNEASLFDKTLCGDWGVGHLHWSVRTSNKTLFTSKYKVAGWIIFGRKSAALFLQLSVRLKLLYLFWHLLD
jgi:hypothetical protein